MLLGKARDAGRTRDLSKCSLPILILEILDPRLRDTGRHLIFKKPILPIQGLHCAHSSLGENTYLAGSNGNKGGKIR